jgi:hypothetical protein
MPREKSRFRAFFIALRTSSLGAEVAIRARCA